LYKQNKLLFFFTYFKCFFWKISFLKCLTLFEILKLLQSFWERAKVSYFCKVLHFLIKFIVV
jgi:hypothetical protein